MKRKSAFEHISRVSIVAFFSLSAFQCTAVAEDCLLLGENALPAEKEDLTGWRNFAHNLGNECPGISYVTWRIGRGDSLWIRAAGQLLPYSDAGVTEALHAGLSAALLSNPRSVLSIISEKELDDICLDTSGDISWQQALEFLDLAIESLQRLQIPEVSKKNRCLDKLRSSRSMIQKRKALKPDPEN